MFYIGRRRGSCCSYFGKHPGCFVCGGTNTAETRNSQVRAWASLVFASECAVGTCRRRSPSVGSVGESHERARPRPSESTEATSEQRAPRTFGALRRSSAVGERRCTDGAFRFGRRRTRRTRLLRRATVGHAAPKIGARHHTPIFFTKIFISKRNS